LRSGKAAFLIRKDLALLRIDQCGAVTITPQQIQAMLSRGSAAATPT